MWPYLMNSDIGGFHFSLLIVGLPVSLSALKNTKQACEVGIRFFVTERSSYSNDYSGAEYFEKR